MKDVIQIAGKNRFEAICSIIALLLIIAVFIGKLLILPSMPVGQDEFNNLSQIYDYERNTLSAPWQNMHVHLFPWLSRVGSNEVDQVIAARIAMFICFIGTTIFLYLLARRFLNVFGSLFSALCYISFTFTIANGASFRTDTLAIFLIMISIWLFVTRSRSTLANVFSGAAMALAVLFTIKSGVYLILFAALLLARVRPLKNAHRSGAEIILSAWFAGGFTGGFLLFYYFHRATLELSIDVAQDGNFFAGIYSKFIDLSQIFPGYKFFLMVFRSDSLIWLLLASGLVIHIIDLYARRYSCRTQSSYILAFTLPLLSLLAYRNTFPYFYVFIMPCAMIFCGYAADRLLHFSKEMRSIISTLLIGFLLLVISINGIATIVYYYINGPVFTARQRELLTVVHRIFPEPVAYLDGCRMLSSFPNAGFFMSSAGMRGYIQSDTPLLKNRITNRKPLFVLADVPHLDLNSPLPPESAMGFRFRRDDWEALRSNYVHYWGPLWIMGRHLTITNRNLKQDFDIVAGGLYTVEAEAEVLVDGILCQNGTVVELREGKHTFEAETNGAEITLRWGDHLYHPHDEPSWEDPFMGPFG